MGKDVTDDRGASETIDKGDEFGEAFALAETGDSGADESAAQSETMGQEGANKDEATEDTATKGDESEDEKYEQRYKTLQGIHRHDREVWETEKAQKEAERAQLLDELEQLRKQSSTPTSEKTAAAEAFIASLTDDQKAQLDEYEKDFEVISEMEGLKRQMELGKLRKELEEWKTGILSKLETQEARLAPITTRMDEVNEATHFDYVKSQHEDYEAYVEDGSLLEWINSKPGYLRPALLATYKEGTKEDVVDLISDFKQESGISQQQVLENVNQRKTRKKQALTSVVTRRGAVNMATGVAQDYDAAFDEALNRS